MSIGKNIKKFRLLNGMEQKDLAEKLHVSNKTISSWECDRTAPKIGMIQELSKILNCDKTDLITDWIVKMDDDVNVLVESKQEISEMALINRLISAYLSAPLGIKESVNKLLDIEHEKQ